MTVPLRLARPPRRAALASLGVAALTGTLAACANDASPSGGQEDPLRISAIPDQDPELLTERESAMAKVLGAELDLPVEYVPVTDYAASVAQFVSGDLDLVFYGGLTGAQARQRVPEAIIAGQRDIDAEFTSVFLAHPDAGLSAFEGVDGLAALAGRRLTFGSETSTSGRLMPSYFLAQAGVQEGDLDGPPGFSGSHDATLELVRSGAFEVGAMNSQVWRSRLEDGTITEDEAVLLLQTPTYHDYHWLLSPQAVERIGGELDTRVPELLQRLHDVSGGPEVLEMYGAERIIPAAAKDYAQIEQAARQLDLLD